MISALRREKWWLAANVIGVAAYLRFSSMTWLEPELRGENVARGGDVVAWAFSALPVAALFLLIDVIWLTIVAKRGARTGEWRSMIALLCVGATWAGALAIDLLGRDGWLPPVR